MYTTCTGCLRGNVTTVSGPYPCGLYPCGLYPCGLYPCGLYPCGLYPCGLYPCGLYPCGQCLIQDKISTSPSPTDRRAVVAPRGRRAARSSHWAIFLLNNIAITNNSTFPKIKLHYSISYCNKTKSNNLI